MTDFTMGGEAAAYLAAIVQSSDDAIVSKTLDGVITSWNPAAEKVFGYSAAEAIGQPITLIIPPDRLSEEADIVGRVRRGETVEHFETERVTKGGGRIQVMLSVSPIRDSGGRVIGASKIARDISERRRGEELSARLAAIVDSSDDAIISQTLDGVIQTWNRAAELMFGYSAAEAVGRHITLIVPDDRHTEEGDVLTRIRGGEQVHHFETVRRTKDGRALNVSLTISPVRNAAGEIIGSSKVSRDVTDRVRADAERMDLLQREQSAREEAESLNRTKDQFLAVLSHELRTPLNAIYGWARMLHDRPGDARLQGRAADVILRNARAQLQLVEDLLDVSRIITGNMRLEVRPVDLRAIVEAALDAVRPAAAAKELDVVATFDADAGPVLGAPDRLQQIVWNLLMNAVKFTPRGGRVETTLRREPSTVTITVTDTGEGIDAQLLPYIFERFRQGDSSSTRAHGGLGIGLALVRHLVDLHGGAVRAESAGAGKGATFVVQLPIGTAQPTEAVASTPAPVGPPSLSRVRILVVDDDADGLDLARVILADAGAEVKACTSGAGVADEIRGWTPDVFVLDIEMPGEDGHVLLRRLRRETAPAYIPALALTAYSSSEDRKRAMSAGFDLHVTKPADPAELVIAIASLVRRRA